MKLHKKLSQWIFAQRYNIAFIENTVENILQGEPLRIRPMLHNYRDRWFADPFIISAGEKVIDLLVEEKYYPIGRGRIARLTVDRESYKLIKNVTILQLDTHLSFPAIIMDGDSLWFYPESIEGGKLVKYKLNLASNTIVEQQAMAYEPLADATLFRNEIGTWLFATTPPDINGRDMAVFREVDGVFRHEECIHFQENVGRSAGDFIVLSGGGVFRVAQICNKRYGEGVLIQKAEFDDGWKFQDIIRLYSEVKDWDIGLHTLNIKDGCIVTDIKGYRYPKIANAILSILSRRNKL